MFSNNWKAAGAVLLAVALVGSARAEKAATATSPDKKIEAAADGKTIVLTDTATGKILAKIAGHTDTVTALALSPDGKYLASGSADKTVRLFDPATGKELRRFVGKDAITSLTFSKDGKTLSAKEGKNGKQTWDVATGKEVE